MYTMGDVARCSLGRPGDYHNEALLYKLFGVNAELLIDHAWGWESCTMADIKAYRPSANSLAPGRCCPAPIPLARRGSSSGRWRTAGPFPGGQGVTSIQLTLTVGYDVENLASPEALAHYRGATVTDHYGGPFPSTPTAPPCLERPTSSARQIMAAATALFERIASEKLLVRRLNLTACQVLPQGAQPPHAASSWTCSPTRRPGQAQDEALAREKRVQETLLSIKKKYGNNAIVLGMSLEEGATARERNQQIGGHKA